RILPSIIEEGLKITIEAAFYGQRLFGEQIRAIADAPQPQAGPTDDTVASISRGINQRLRTMQGTLLPPVLTVATKVETTGEKSPGFWALFLPGLLFMAVMFAAQGM